MQSTFWAMIWGGAAVTIAGVILLAVSAILAGRVRRDTTLTPVEGKALLARALWFNLGGLATAGLGLMAVIVGLILR